MMTLKEVHEELHLKGRLQEAEQFYTQFLADDPDNWLCLFFLGTLYMQTMRNGLAIQCFDRASILKPAAAEIWNNLGTAYKRENHNEKAKFCFLRSLLHKKDPETYTNLSTCYINEGCPSSGMKYSDLSLKMDPRQIHAHWNRSLLFLEQGNYGKGFDEYFWGLKSKDRMNRDYNAPLYRGEKGKTVVVWGEQGIGDEIMFSSIIPDLQKRSKDVIFDCHPRLIKLFERSFSIKCYPTRKESPDWMWDENIDAKTPIGGLGSYFRRNIKDFPGTPYLKADPDKVSKYRKLLEESGPGPYIGISWTGGKKKTRVDLRSVPLEKLFPLFKEKATFVNLQYTKEDEQAAIKANLLHLPYIIYNFDYDETAALIAALDLVITVNTSIVHLSGALGKEAWVLTPVKKAWRYYSEDGKKIPWYNSVRLYQQQEAGKWDDVISRVSDDLHTFVASRGNPKSNTPELPDATPLQEVV